MTHSRTRLITIVITNPFVVVVELPAWKALPALCVETKVSGCGCGFEADGLRIAADLRTRSS
jgi:hypothetical protein